MIQNRAFCHHVSLRRYVYFGPKTGKMLEVRRAVGVNGLLEGQKIQKKYGMKLAVWEWIKNCHDENCFYCLIIVVPRKMAPNDIWMS